VATFVITHRVITRLMPYDQRAPSLTTAIAALLALKGKVVRDKGNDDDVELDFDKDSVSAFWTEEFTEP